jgi:hypothetical protein
MKFAYQFPSSQQNVKVLIEVVKENSEGEVDNFTGVLNRLAGSEAISMIYVRLSYISIHHTLLSSSLSDDFLHPKPNRDSLNKYFTSA